jgi:hypothetical protein
MEISSEGRTEREGGCMLTHPKYPPIEDFITYDGKCAVCFNRMRGDFCLKKLRVVEKTDTCELFKMGGRKK